MANIPLLKFNAGEASPLIDARSDVEKYNSLCRTLQNFIPRIYGGVERRPGTYYYQTAYDDTDGTVRLVPFIYSSTIAYVLEFGVDTGSTGYIRALYDGAVIDTISSPYGAADLFALQTRQLGDTMWIVHKDYQPRKLTRTSATTFSLDAITFRNGPFLTRNDLINPESAGDTATMTCTVTDVGDTGTLTCNSSVFDADHVGALFKLVHPRVNTKVTQSGEGTSTAIDIKGTFSFNTHGTWTGTVVLQRRENSSSANDWEDYRTFVGNNDRNVQFSGTEEFENVEYRIEAQAGMSAAFKAEITSHEPTQTGIVRIDSVASAISAGVTVVRELASTNATQRWAEGAWSDYRGWPSTVTFKDDRCIYGGASIVQQLILQEYEYASDTGDTPLYAYGDYDNPDNNDQIVAQTFTPVVAHSIKQISLRLYHNESTTGAGTDCIIAIREADQDTGYPILTGTALTSLTFDGNATTTQSTGDIYTYEFDTAYALTAGTLYSIVLYAPSGVDSNNCLAVLFESGQDTYTVGQLFYYQSNGVTWSINTSHQNEDIYFSESGYPV